MKCKHININKIEFTTEGGSPYAYKTRELILCKDCGKNMTDYLTRLHILRNSIFSFIEVTHTQYLKLINFLLYYELKK